MKLPERKLLVLADEPTFANCKEGRRHIWTYDVREPSKPDARACPARRAPSSPIRRWGGYFSAVVW